ALAAILVTRGFRRASYFRKADSASGSLARQPASTAASSIAIAPPCARNGAIACAASPRSATGPAVHGPRGSTAASAYLHHAGADAMTALAPVVQAAKSSPMASGSPEAFQPGWSHASSTMATTLTARPAETG